MSEPKFAYNPHSDMAYRRCDDGHWYVLDVTGEADTEDGLTLLIEEPDA